LTENPTQLNALVVQQSKEEAAANLTTCKCGKIPTKYAENKTLLNFYYLSTTLCTDTENETRKRNENENETKNEAQKQKKIKKNTREDPIRSAHNDNEAALYIERLRLRLKHKSQTFGRTPFQPITWTCS